MSVDQLIFDEISIIGQKSVQTGVSVCANTISRSVKRLISQYLASFALGNIVDI